MLLFFSARLEGLCKLYGTRIIISGTLHDLVSHQFVCKQLDLVTVVGREQHTFVYEVLTERTDPKSGEEISAFERQCLEMERKSQVCFLFFLCFFKC